MRTINNISKIVVDASDFQQPTSDIQLNITLSDGEQISFIAQKDFFTPRKIATNTSEILGMENIVEYTATNIPIVKMPIGAKDITTPQYYINSIVKDVYQPVKIDNYFRELTDDLAIPANDPSIRTIQDQRLGALQNALALDDLSSALASGDADAVAEATSTINDGTAAYVASQVPDPAALLTPADADELAALSFVGIGGQDIGIDTASDVISPVPSVAPEDVIQSFPLLSGKIAGIDTINRAINLLNTGVDQVETANKTAYDAACGTITIAEGKRGFLGIGKSNAQVVKRTTVQQARDKVQSELSRQQNSPTVLVGYYKRRAKVSTFQAAVYQAQTSASNVLPDGQAADLFGQAIVVPFRADADVYAVPNFVVPMTRDEALLCLSTAKKKLEDILNKDPNCASAPT